MEEESKNLQHWDSPDTETSSSSPLPDSSASRELLSYDPSRAIAPRYA
ncbi:MAG: hypothetical protein AAGE92_05415 [Cyanobacteria bacterium P01_G01_bin.4]